VAIKARIDYHESVKTSPTDSDEELAQALAASFGEVAPATSLLSEAKLSSLGLVMPDAAPLDRDFWRRFLVQLRASTDAKALDRLLRAAAGFRPDVLFAFPKGGMAPPSSSRDFEFPITADEGDPGGLVSPAPAAPPAPPNHRMKPPDLRAIRR
jgi:hypothetical protein